MKNYEELFNKWFKNNKNYDFYKRYIEECNRLIPDEYITYNDIHNFINENYYYFVCENKIYNSGIPIGNYYLATLIEYKRVN